VIELATKLEIWRHRNASWQVIEMSGVFLHTYECFNLQPVPQQDYSPGCKLHIPTQLWKLVIAKVMQ